MKQASLFLIISSAIWLLASVEEHFLQNREVIRWMLDTRNTFQKVFFYLQPLIPISLLVFAISAYQRAKKFN